MIFTKQTHDFYIWSSCRGDSGIAQNTYKSNAGYISSTTLEFWVTDLERILIEVVRMGHTDHLGFRLNSDFDMYCFHPHMVLLGKHTFPDVCGNELIRLE